MNNTLTRSIAFGFSTIAVLLASGFAYQDPSGESKPKSDAKSSADEKIEFAPVDEMGHFMEYICQPCYKSLKEAMKTAPANRKEWKPIKVNALILAESSALVANRAPDDLENVKQWQQISKDVHDAGASLYQSAAKMNFEEAKTHYEAMIDSCNKCHQVFDKGKHQLEK
jgi:hypothetical protein